MSAMVVTGSTVEQVTLKGITHSPSWSHSEKGNLASSLDSTA